MSNPIEKARNFARIAGLTTAIVTCAGLSGVYASVDVDGSGSNSVTGANSDNRNFTDVDTNNDWTLNNDDDIDNNIDADVNTGDNDILRNTEVGDFMAGDIEVGGEFVNDANGGVGDMGDMSDTDVNVDHDGDNSTTGANSVNRNRLRVRTNNDWRINNDANIDNDVDLNLNSGGNRVSSASPP